MELKVNWLDSIEGLTPEKAIVVLYKLSEDYGNCTLELEYGYEGIEGSFLLSVI